MACFVGDHSNRHRYLHLDLASPGVLLVQGDELEVCQGAAGAGQQAAAAREGGSGGSGPQQARQVAHPAGDCLAKCASALQSPYWRASSLSCFHEWDIRMPAASLQDNTNGQGPRSVVIIMSKIQ